MNYTSTVLLLMAVLIAAVLVAVFIVIGLFYVNVDTGGNPPQTVATTPTVKPTTRQIVTTVQTPSNQDPIIGPWMNGMVFYPNGTVINNGGTPQTWQVNLNENNSYFLISGGQDITSTEWQYNPDSDKIGQRGSLESFSRGKPAPTPKPVTTITTVTTQQTQVVNTTSTPKPFSYSDCIDVCKINYYADRQIGFYNDCLNTCNIENLRSPAGS